MLIGTITVRQRECVISEVFGPLKFKIKVEVKVPVIVTSWGMQNLSFTFDPSPSTGSFTGLQCI